MANRIEVQAQPSVPPALSARSFSCGCRRISGPGAEFHVEWCPHHEANHGELSESVPAAVEELAVVPRLAARRTAGGER